MKEVMYLADQLASLKVAINAGYVDRAVGERDMKIIMSKLREVAPNLLATAK